MELGSIYILQTNDERYVKIGFTTRLVMRLQEIQCTMFAHDHGGISVIGFLPASRDVETELHRELADWRFHGDWYDREVLNRFAQPLLPLASTRRVVNPIDFQRAGGLARAANLSRERRIEIARNAGKAGGRGRKRNPAKVKAA